MEAKQFNPEHAAAAREVRAILKEETWCEVKQREVRYALEQSGGDIRGAVEWIKRNYKYL